MKRVLLLGLGLCGCFDFGYDVPPAALQESMGGSADGGTENMMCSEGEVSPSASGPQVKFIALNVDTATLKVAPGSIVTWTNADSMPHSVVAGAPGAETPTTKGGFSSPDVPPDGKWAYRFCTKRSLFYFCGKHPSQMSGYRVVVE